MPRGIDVTEGCAEGCAHGRDGDRRQYGGRGTVIGDELPEAIMWSTDAVQAGAPQAWSKHSHDESKGRSDEGSRAGTWYDADRGRNADRVAARRARPRRR